MILPVLLEMLEERDALVLLDAIDEADLEWGGRR
jgi:hypothetical protein